MTQTPICRSWPTSPLNRLLPRPICWPHAIFESLDENKGLSSHLRAGFFAQQHDLPAAGCRPDIEHDEEFSSYFWGALAGQSRNGMPIKGCDIDESGVVSFAEAYAHAVIAGETIDIPLRTSEVLLRAYSRLTANKSSDAPNDAEQKAEASEQDGNEQPKLFTMTGNLETFLDKGRPISSHIVTQLSKTLELSLEDDVTAVMKAFDESRRRVPGGGKTRPC